MTIKAERWAMLGGIAFVVVFAAGILLITGHLPDTSGLHTAAAVDAKVLHTYAQSDNKDAILIGGYLTILSGLALIWFLTGLRARLRRAGESETVSGLVFSFGLAAAVLIMAGGGAFATIAADLTLGNDPAIQNADAARFLPELGYPLLLIGAMLSLATVIAICTVVARRGVALPRWLSYAGWLAVAGAVLAVAFTPMILVPLWVLAVSITGLRATARPEPQPDRQAVAANA